LTSFVKTLGRPIVTVPIANFHRFSNPLLRQNAIAMTQLVQPTLLFQMQAKAFSAERDRMFGTDSPAKSNRYHLGLFHGKTHAQRKKRCFSNKFRLETQKPNIYMKKLYSDVLERDFTMWISMKTRKCIMKAGSLDNYLLTAHPKKLDSKFGMHLRDMVKERKKQIAKGADPATYNTVYVPGTAKQNRTRKTKLFEYKRIPAMYVPTHVRANVDMSEFYMKPPHEMSRYELQKLERFLRLDDEGMLLEPEAAEFHIKEELQQFDENGEPLSKEEIFKQTHDFKEIQGQLRNLQPIRMGVFKKYWNKFKYNRQRREYMVEVFDSADVQVQLYLGDEYVNWRDEIEGAREFLADMEL